MSCFFLFFRPLEKFLSFPRRDLRENDESKVKMSKTEHALILLRSQLVHIAIFDFGSFAWTERVSKSIKEYNLVLRSTISQFNKLRPPEV